MSENTQGQKAPAKAKGLGRGLGSLLGPTNEGAFSKTTPAAEKTLQNLTESLSSRSQPALQEGFIEKPVPASPPINAPAVPNALRIWQIPIEKLDPNPDQPRQIFAKEALEELANSIREKGIIQPLLVRKKGDGFEIIAGERRWRAAQLAGLNEVPALVKTSEDQEVLELALIENIQRENLNVIEEAEAYDFLLKKYNMTQQELAQKVGKDRATVANVLRLLQLEPGVRQMVSRNELSLGQAKVLLSVGEPKLQESLAGKARGENLSVRALEKLVAKHKAGPAGPPTDEQALRAKLAKSLGEELQKLIGSKVILDYDEGKGKVSIQFYSDEELNQIAERLRKAWPS
jgi:ParB family chromosome partitioning protein